MCDISYRLTIVKSGSAYWKYIYMHGNNIASVSFLPFHLSFSDCLCRAAWSISSGEFFHFCCCEVSHARYRTYVCICGVKYLHAHPTTDGYGATSMHIDKKMKFNFRLAFYCTSFVSHKMCVCVCTDPNDDNSLSPSFQFRFYSIALTLTHNFRAKEE